MAADGRTIPDGVYSTAAELLEKGESAAAVEQRLVAMGVSADTAKRIVAEQNQASAVVAQSDGRTDLKFGAIGAVLGVVILVIDRGSIIGWFGLIAGSVNVYRGWKKGQRAAAA